jgi:hypothetical protein
MLCQRGLCVELERGQRKSELMIPNVGEAKLDVVTVTSL